MNETFLEKWRHRISNAWAVLTGRAYACWYRDSDDFEPFPTDDGATS